MSLSVTKDSTVILPRLIRLRDAAFYVGMDKNRFNQEVRPYLTSLPIGNQGVAFDRIDLDNWVDDYKSRNGRPSTLSGDNIWDAKERPGSASVVTTVSGTSKNRSSESAFVKALAQAISKKPS